MRTAALLLVAAAAALAGESQISASRAGASRVRLLAAARGGSDGGDDPSAPTGGGAASGARDPDADGGEGGGMLSSALAMIADGSMLARLQAAAAADPAARARIAELLAQPSIRASLRAAGFAVTDGEVSSVEAVLARMAEPETVERMRALAQDPLFREKLAAAHAEREGSQPAARADAAEAAEAIAAAAEPAGADGEALLRKVRAARSRRATPLSPPEAAALQAGAAVLARHEGEGGVWLSAEVTAPPRALPGGGTVCDVRYADGEAEAAVPASRLALRTPHADGAGVSAEAVDESRVARASSD